MKDKILVNLIVPILDNNYSVYLPINKNIGNIIELLNKAIFEMISNDEKVKPCNFLYDRNTGVRYANSEFIYKTDIHNGSILILL